MVMVEIGEREFNRLIRARRPVLAVCSTPWYSPPDEFHNSLEHLREEFEGRAELVMVDVEKHKRLAEAHGVTRVPTLLFIKGGVVLDTVSEELKESEIRRRLRAIETSAVF